MMETIQQRLDKLETGHWLLIIAPNIEHMMTGTRKVGVKKNGTIMVEYEDGVIEERKGSEALLGTMDADSPSLFGLVGFVQDGREQRKEQR